MCHFTFIKANYSQCGVGLVLAEYLGPLWAITNGAASRVLWKTMPLWQKVGEVGKPLLSLQRIPGWPQTERWGSVARTLAGWAAPANWPGFQQAAGVTSEQLLESLQRLRANRQSGTERRAMGELGWLLLTTLWAQDEEVLRWQRALDEKASYADWSESGTVPGTPVCFSGMSCIGWVS